MENHDPKHLEKLLSLHAENMLDSQQQQEMAALLTENADARDAYIEHMMFHAAMFHQLEVGSEFSPLANIQGEKNGAMPMLPSELPEENEVIPELFGNLSELPPELLWGIAAPKEEQAKPPILGFLGDYFNNGISFLSRNIVLVIILLPLLAIFTVLWSSPLLWKSPPKGWTLTARVVETIDCQWEQGSIHPGTGSFLIPGQTLNLKRGLAELEFVSGTRVFLQGPTEFTIAGENSSTLEMGRLAAVVPEGAEGFTVKTPNMDVIDLGTEFGVAIDALGLTDVQVFKGSVRAEVFDSVPSASEELTTQKGTPSKPAATKRVARSKPTTKKILLKKDEAIQYRQETKEIVKVAVREKQFVRDLRRDDGVTSDLNCLVNPSFEVPEIRKLPEYDSKQGCTPSRSLHGWYASRPAKKNATVAMYQISPYTSIFGENNVGPGATDGHQVATIILDAKPGKATPTTQSKDAERRSSWIFQSLGVVTPGDIGKTLKLSVDAGPRSSHDGSQQGKGMVFAGFALGVTEKQSGTGIGRPAFFMPKREIQELHPLEATMKITVDYVGQELFVLLAASDNGYSDTVDQYHFDNVQLGLEE